ncbi:hypothetical protein FQN57_004626 [Myotisia sp. PD_48]|nr:hypothetical protein FQN57_004626 [Myotisia sp. PD_48]
MSSNIEILKNLYHYIPSKPAAIIFAVLYGLSAVFHELQYRATRPQKFTVPLILGAVFSTVGFIARSLNALNLGSPGSIWRISSMFILGAGPTYAGADYFVCGRLFSYVRMAAPMSPLLTVKLFLSLDILAEVAVWVGSGIQDSKNLEAASSILGRNLVRVAMSVQLGLFLCFSILVFIFQRRAVNRGVWKPSYGEKGVPGWIKVVYTLYASSVLIMIRSGYHIAGKKICLTPLFAMLVVNINVMIESFLPIDHPFRTNEAPFMFLEALLMLINVVMFNIFNPGFLLPRNSHIYLLPDGTEEEDESAEWTLEDTRPSKQKILDPFDIRGLITRRQMRKNDSRNEDREYEMITERLRMPVERREQV